MLKPQLPTDVEGENFIGLGWFCAGKGDAFQCFHEGWDEGFVAGLWLYPAAGKDVAIMINSNQGEPPLSRKPHSFGQNRAGHRWVAAKRRHGRGGEMAHLETDRLLLREVRASDADDFLRYRQQEDYWRHVPIVPPTADSIAASVNGWIQSQDKNPRTAHNFAIIVRKKWWATQASSWATSVRGRARSDGESFQVTEARALQPKSARPCYGLHLTRSTCTEFLRSAASRIRRPAG
jgi:hypothetical protein